MAHLPFLVVYGAWVWKIALVVPIALCFGVIAVVRRWIAQNDAAFAAAESVAKAHATAEDAAEAGRLAPGPVYLVGTLHGGTITCVSQRGRWAGRRDDDLWLEHGAERISITGTVQLEAGASSRASWFARNVPVPALQARLRPTLVQTVGEGDEIVVSGVVQAAATDASYREAPRRWRLVAPPGAAMRAWSTSPRLRPLPLGPWRSAAIALVTATLGCMGLVRLGQYLAEDDNGPHLESMWSIELACALPGWRGEGLRALETTLDRRNRMDELLALHAFEGTCPDDVLANAHRFDEAIAAAKRCGRAKRAGEIAAVHALTAAGSGQIDEALAAVAGANDPHLTADLLAWAGRTDDAVAAAKGAGDAELAIRLLVQMGRFDDAAPLLDAGSGSPARTLVAIARGDWSRAADQLLMQSEAAIDPTRSGCIASLFRTWGGDAKAFDGDQPCDAYRALATVPEAADPDLDHPMAMLPRYWLARFAPAAEVQAQLAWIDVLRGDFAAARQALAAAGGSPIAPDVAAQLALHEGSAMPPAVALENQALWWRLRAGEPVPAPELCTDEPGDCPFGAGLEAAEHGDGGPLADAIRAYGHDWTSVAGDVLALAPRITAHRAELAAALHTVSAESRGSIFDFVASAAARRDLAHLLGDEATAARWQAAVARFDAVLADRQKATALVLLEPR